LLEGALRPKPAPSSVYRQVIVDLVNRERARVVVEIGVYSGKLSRMLASTTLVERLYLVDPWGNGSGAPLGRDDAHMEAVFREVSAWAKGHPCVRILRHRSIVAADWLENGSVDLVEIDGDHSLDGVMGDVTAWLPKVRAGGIICGDNYELAEVAEAVNRLLPDRQLLANGRVWVHRKSTSSPS
jgi:hypothetical protein